MALLSCFFLVLYQTCLFATSLRQNIGVLYFEWERQIPFIPWAIIPYLSIYLLFPASALLIRTTGELGTITKRIIFAVGISVICFLAFPLQFTFEHPQVFGLLKPLFTFQSMVDRPYNLAPALHVSLSLIVWGVYHKHTTELMRLAASIWFLLIMLSALFTYQHHFIDIVSGATVGIFSFYLFRSRPI